MPDLQRANVPTVHANGAEHRRQLAERANASLAKDGTVPATAPIPLKNYAVADLPDAGLWSGAIVFVSDETGGAVIAFSDGTDWRRSTDRAVVS